MVSCTAYAILLCCSITVLLMIISVVLLYTNYYPLPSNIFYLFAFSSQYFIVVEHV